MSIIAINGGSKAETLARLAPLVSSARILPLTYFSIGRWRRERVKVLHEIQVLPWAQQPLIVRSSAVGEDSTSDSRAGKYRSVPGVEGQAMLEWAIDTVAKSYDRTHDDDQILVQPELIAARASGVAFSCDPSNGAPYRLINCADGQLTTAVTQGMTGGIQTWYVARRRGQDENETEIVKCVVTLLSELEVLTGFEELEAEFAIDAGGDLVLFQARPLRSNASLITLQAHEQVLSTVAERLSTDVRPVRPVLGRRTVFGVMPDWNPAEMIGRRPRPLARSLYQTLITDETWAIARASYSYRDLRGVPLMRDYAGLPYIDVAASFTSLCPADLPDELTNRLVDQYIDRLIAHPYLHDKVEFEIVLSCWLPDLGDRLAKLYGDAFNRAERRVLIASLTTLTERLVAPGGPWQRDLAQLGLLSQDRSRVERTAPGTPQRIVALLKHCAQYGTLPFAGLARAAFVATQIFESLRRTGQLTVTQTESFLAGLHTVAGELRSDLSHLCRSEFLALYGHLRPGTYDILSPRYDEEPDRYFDWSLSRTVRPAPALCNPEPALLRQIAGALAGHRLGITAHQLLNFMAEAIKGRERAKFEFTRELSEILRCVGGFGAMLGFTLDDMSYLDVPTIERLTADPAENRHIVAAQIERGRAEHAICRSVSLPPLLNSPSDVFKFQVPETEPNFVTQKRVIARVADVAQGGRLEGAIALISSADPGYDWLFARGIVGLVTAYGGSNSHMAVRALELGIPAVLGVGERRLQKWLSVPLLDIDAANRLVKTPL